MKQLIAFFKRETVLSIAWILAALSMLLVPPSRDYIHYIDFHTLGLLFSLMAVMAGLQGQGLFRHLGEEILAHTKTTRQLEGVLIFLPFLASMAVTNDVALITFAPFALEVLRMANEEHRVIPVVAMQTIAANLGSMTTPIGNPQNLYLYNQYQLSLGTFFSTMLPLTLLSALLLVLFLFSRKSYALPAPELTQGYYHPGKRMRMYLILFLISLTSVVGILPVWMLTVLILILILASDRWILGKVDYSLLITFVGFFLFVGNLGQLPLFRDLFQSILAENEVGCSILASQAISNVPAALLLSGFTQNGTALLVGTNLGGLGTLIASMASLISYKQLARHYSHLRMPYLIWFTAANLIFLAVLSGAYCLFMA